MKSLFNKFLVGLFLTPILGYSQDLNNLNIVPPSPNAAALGKYGNMPVSYNTGTTNINIPIYKYNVPDKDFSLDVSLNYHTGGVRVDETASTVGLGWALSAGGTVSRTMVGLPDDSQYGYMRNGAVNYTNTDLMDYVRGANDSEPDIYNYNFNGRSGRFSIAKTSNGGGVLLSEKNGMKIEYTVISSSDPRLDKFIITTEQGIKYTFSDTETTHFRSTFLGSVSYTSSWLLSRIDFPYSPKPITFSYDPYYIEYNSGVSQTARFYTDWWNYSSGQPGNSSPSYPPHDDLPSPSMNLTRVSGKRLININFLSNENLSFVYNIERTDLPGDKQLNFIYIDQDKTKGFKLEYSYISSRLFLQKVSQIASSSSLSPYQLEYDLNVPSRLSLSQDFWGFNNGKNNSTLIPKLAENELNYFTVRSRATPASQINDGNRDPDSNYVQGGILKKVIYPTGGYSTFVYEINTTADGQFVPYQTVQDKDLYLTGFEENRTATFRLDKNCVPGALPFTFRFRDYPHGLATNYNFKFTIKSLDDAVTYGAATFNYSHRNGHEFIVNNSSYMTKGEYKIVWSTNYTGVIEEPFTFSLKWKDIVTDMVQNSNRVVGGVRIKEISDHDGAGNFTSRMFKYVKNDGFSSSGKMLYMPTYSYDFSEEWYAIGVRSYLCKSSFPGQALSALQGSSIVYERVIEKFKNGSLSNGETRYLYTVPANPYTDNVFPFPTMFYSPWENGLLRQTEVFDSQNILKKKEINTYATITTQDEIVGNKIGQTLNSDAQNLWKFSTSEYFIPSGYALKQQTRVTDYLSVTDSITTVTDYTFEPPTSISHFQPIVVIQNWGTGQGKKETLLYPKDFSNNGFVSNMLSRNIIAVPIEQVAVNENNEVLSGVINQYLLSGLLKEKVMQFESLLPIPLTNFKYSNQATGVSPFTGAPQSFAPDNRYVTKANFLRYDTDGKLLNYSKPGSPQNSFLWSYKGKYPVVSIINGDYTVIESILGGAAAIKSFSDSNPVSLTAIEDFISPLRLDSRLKDAQFSVYSYDPLVGLTSSMDAKGVITYYEYDSFQRLKVIKDHNQHIIKSYDYNYKN